MDLAPLGLAIYVCRTVPFVFGVGQIIDHLAQGLGISRRGIGLSRVCHPSTLRMVI
jgi:hypothetical protein